MYLAGLILIVLVATLALRGAGAPVLEDDSADPTIDALIAEKGCQSYRPGMDKPDYRILRRVEETGWQNTVAAQRAAAKSPEERREARRKADRRGLRLA